MGMIRTAHLEVSVVSVDRRSSVCYDHGAIDGGDGNGEMEGFTASLGPMRRTIARLVQCALLTRHIWIAGGLQGEPTRHFPSRVFIMPHSALG